MSEEYMQTVMMIIMYGGNAKALSIEAINAAKEGDFEKAAAKLKEADESIHEAHNSQTAMLTNDANVANGEEGELTPITLYMVHAQDHIMNAITFRDLAEEIINLHIKIAEK
ncbi:MAG: PTS lactose/cellobiose transporter subunit IIA [Lactobacillaceae bacterium]|jgi:PTS system cellobiose-specific IIA component|nr:PTS lactose/cellobiose transporter subunit IIA [Lactobacillaceae bacterium]